VGKRGSVGDIRLWALGVGRFVFLMDWNGRRKSPWRIRQTETAPVKTFNALFYSFFAVSCRRTLVAVLAKFGGGSHSWSGSRGMAGMAFWYKHRALCARKGP